MAARARLGKLLLLAASAALTLGLAEAALRLAGISYPNFYRPDPERGWSLQPGAEGWWRKEGSAPVRINSDGLRDREHALAKPPGTVRIAVLGDSCAEALQVPVEATFWHLLEARLAACPTCRTLAGRPVEVLNFGVSGYGTAQELLTLRGQVWKYRPDIVLLAFYTGNDVRNNERALEQDPLRPYFVLAASPGSSAGPRLTLDDSFRRSSGYELRRSGPARLLYGVFNRSRLLQLAKRAKSALDDRVGAWKARRVTTQPIEELGLDNAVYSPPATPEWRAAWEVTEAMLREMSAEVRAKGARFGIVTLSDGIQVHPDPARRRAFERQLGLTTLFYPDERIREVGKAAGIPVLNLAPALAEYAARTGRFLHGFPNTAPGEGHWNAEGHRQASRLMAPWLCQVLSAGGR
ncbi:MAG TPA: SGNH/GDSL hydrolase family protein [Thermoanaerobaculia bacterium]|nr:SGNH/GDSL hydrolase family protein [Thermoanaerobaculia bacterium]